MVKREIVTINGGLGSGKSSTAKGVARALGFEHFSSGDFFRQAGLELGLSINEINEKEETEHKVDQAVDEKLRQMRGGGKIVIDSRMAFHWIPESFKVYLDLSPQKASERIIKSLEDNELRHQSEQSTSPEKVLKNIRERLESEQKRYWDLYKIDNSDKSHYDLVVDTGKNNLKEVTEIIANEYRKWIKN